MQKIVKHSLSLAERLYLPILGGLKITFSKIFRKRFTRQYPEEPLLTTVVTRGQPRLVENPDATLRCVACGLCEFACPADAITIWGGETDREIEREPKRFEIDMLRCILCGFCEEACPKEAIYMSDELELADYTREAHILGIDKLRRSATEMEKRIRYAREMYDKWQTPSSTS